MAGRYFGIPFAATGDKTTTPDAVQPDGSVSYAEGFGFDYERPNTDPAYKPVPRDGMNGLFYDITEAVGIIQKQGAADWTASAAPYVVNARARHSDKYWLNTIPNNSDEPGVGAGWVETGGPASQAEAEAGTENTKYSTPLRVFQALRSAAANATETLRGVLRVGTQVEVEAGTLDDVAVTPKKLRMGFSISLAQNGYIIFPSWLGGLVLQWMLKTSISNGSAVTFPIAFPTEVFVCLGSDLSGSTSSELSVFGVINLTTTGLSVRTAGINDTFYIIAIGR